MPACRRCSSAASMRIRSIRATSRSAELLTPQVRSRVHRAARPGRRGRHAAGRAGIPRPAVHRQRRHGLGHRHGQAAHQAAGAGRGHSDHRLHGAARSRRPRQLHRAARPAADRQARHPGLVGGHDQGREGRTVAGRLPGRRAARAQRVRRAVDHRRRIHGRGAAGTRAAVDPHRDAGDVLRLPGQVLPQRHQVSTARRACRPRPRSTSPTWRSPPSTRSAPRAGAAPTS